MGKQGKGALAAGRPRTRRLREGVERGAGQRGGRRGRAGPLQRLICAGGAGGAVSFKDYAKYNAAGMKLNNKLMEKSLGKDALKRVGTLFGIVDKSGTMVFKSEMEMHAVMDVALCDLKGKDGRTPVEAYMEDIGPANDVERALLEARINSTTSLFRVTGSDAREGTVDLSDLLHGSGDVTIYNKGMSQTAGTTDAAFIRLFRLPKANTASGIVFAFHGNRVPALIRKYNKIRAREGQGGALSRYALFFKLHRRYGIPSGLVG